jgi:hypothetical protein
MLRGIYQEIASGETMEALEDNLRKASVVQNLEPFLRGSWRMRVDSYGKKIASEKIRLQLIRRFII